MIERSVWGNIEFWFSHKVIDEYLYRIYLVNTLPVITVICGPNIASYNDSMAQKVTKDYCLHVLDMCPTNYYPYGV